MWRNFLRNFSLWPHVALISSKCSYIIRGDLRNLQENVCLKQRRRTMSTPTFPLCNFRTTNLHDQREISREVVRAIAICKTRLAIYSQSPVLFLLPFRNPVKLAVILNLVTDLQSKFPSAFLLFDKCPVSACWASTLLISPLLYVKVCRQQEEGKLQPSWLATGQHSQKWKLKRGA